MGEIEEVKDQSIKEVLQSGAGPKITRFIWDDRTIYGTLDRMCVRK